MKYREHLQIEGSSIRVSGGQGDWIVVAGRGPDGAFAETAIPRDSLQQAARMLLAMHSYLEGTGA